MQLEQELGATQGELLLAQECAERAVQEKTEAVDVATSLEDELQAAQHNSDHAVFHLEERVAELMQMKGTARTNKVLITAARVLHAWGRYCCTTQARARRLLACTRRRRRWRAGELLCGWRAITQRCALLFTFPRGAFDT